MVFLILLFIGLVWLSVSFYLRCLRLQKSHKALSVEKAALITQNETIVVEKAAVSAHNEMLVRECLALEKYRPIVDVENFVQQTRERLAAEAEQAQRQSADERLKANEAVQVYMTRAGDEATSIILQARKLASQEEAQASAHLVAAQLEAVGVLQQARARADDMARDALVAKENLEVYRSEGIALRNVINGYGREYIVPGHSLLDDLAEEFGYVEAGEKLKAARKLMRSLIKKDRAATCGYVEANRRETAIAFVTDAFNGKVDSVLARVKADNAGTLRQEILDAYALVNLNGRAFRDATIQKEYLDARLDELRWAAVAQELKNAEREEQRQIKERIREEEKASREYERAIKEATKEEDTIKKAMDRVRNEVEKASDEQRAKYEAQLLDLSTKLQAAEEKNKRALSMAQQTKSGHVYIISNVGSFGEDVYKIGLTRRLEPLDRVKELGDASVPFEFDVHALIASEDAPALERSLHRHFLASQINKVNHRKEFFNVPLRKIRAELESMGVKTAWTMTSEAADYRESEAINKAIAKSPASLDAWVNRQLVLDPVVMDEAEEAVAAE